MLNTTNYNFKQYEATDLFNPLTVEAQNIVAIDEAIKETSDTGIPVATELKSGTIHAITRRQAGAAMFRFVATADWAAGDTCTVDGVQVSTLLPTGEALPAGAWVINANVLCCLVGTLLTVFTAQPTGGGTVEIDATTLQGHEASYFAVAAETAKKSVANTVQLGVGLWAASGEKYTQSVAVANVTENAPNLVASPDSSSWDKAVDCGIRMTAQGNGVVVFTADSVPDSTVYFNVLLVY